MSNAADRFKAWGVVDRVTTDYSCKSCDGKGLKTVEVALFATPGLMNSSPTKVRVVCECVEVEVRIDAGNEET